ncbi:hypothetical protein [Pseudomonas mediterranea]
MAPSTRQSQKLSPFFLMHRQNGRAVIALCLISSGMSEYRDMRGIIMLVGMAASFSAVAYADTDVKKEIIDRCKSQMGTYGAAMVKACVDQDLDALAAVNKIPEKYKPTVARCMKQMRIYGFAMVKACADQDIEAEKALSEY